MHDRGVPAHGPVLLHPGGEVVHEGEQLVLGHRAVRPDGDVDDGGSLLERDAEFKLLPYEPYLLKIRQQLLENPFPHIAALIHPKRFWTTLVYPLVASTPEHTVQSEEELNSNSSEYDNLNPSRAVQVSGFLATYIGEDNPRHAWKSSAPNMHDVRFNQ